MNRSKKNFFNMSLSFHMMNYNITEIDLALIKRLHSILQVLNCLQNVNVNKFKTFCKETTDLIDRLYPWYNIPVTVHKVLTHGDILIQSCFYPIGTYSEENIESLHKVIRRNRLTHSRKSSRVNTMRDVYNRLLISSNPLISSIKKGQKVKHVLTNQAKEMIEDDDILFFSELSISSDEE